MTIMDQLSMALQMDLAQKIIIYFILALISLFSPLTPIASLTTAKVNIYPSNSPYTKKLVAQNILFRNFSEQPKHLDPGRSYSSDEYVFISQIYEPPYEYHYLLRPYQLSPLSADGDFKLEYLDSNNNIITDKNGQNGAHQIAYSVYTIRIKPGILYQPHPALVKDSNNKYSYHNLNQQYHMHPSY